MTTELIFDNDYQIQAAAKEGQGENNCRKGQVRVL